MYSLPYGRSFIQLPDLWDGRAETLVPGPFPGIDQAAAVEGALNNPLGEVSLRQLCLPGEPVAVVVPDLTRRAAVRVYLPVLLKKLADLGVRDKDITIVVALGIHRPLAGHELAELVGEGVLGRYRVVNHDADGPESNVLLGVTDAGIPVEINRNVALARSVILTGGISYHYFAGYGGGRKSFLPGVASRRACEAHHRLVVSWRRGDLEGEMAPGVLTDNPVHRQMLQACSFSPPIFVLNVVTDPGDNIVAASAGQLETAHLDACRKHDSWFRREVSSSSRLVIASPGGFPRDVNFVQAHKGLFASHAVVSREGLVLLAARCSEGTGHPDLLDWFQRCTSEEKWLSELEAGYQINGQTAFSTWLRVRSVPTVLVSDMDPDDVRLMGMIPAGNLAGGLEAARELLGELPVPLILPDAGDILPVIKEKGKEWVIGNRE